MRHNSYGLDLYIYFVSTHNNVLRVLRHQEICRIRTRYCCIRAPHLWAHYYYLQWWAVVGGGGGRAAGVADRPPAVAQ